ncbi:MAG: HD domain-containing protein, partial [Bacillota bacterium]
MRQDCGSIVNLTIEVPDHVAEVARELDGRGYQAYVVGGAVRDSLMGRRPKDWDVCTSATPAEVEGIFGDRAIPTGKRYGTVTVLSGKDEVEVTTFRSDGVYADGRRPDIVVFSSDVKEDLARRDFTINAMAYDIRRQAVIDCFDGLRDLQAKVVRTVGDARLRFSEDALRMPRAIRLAVELGFSVCPETLDAIRESHEAIVKISWERIRDELTAMLLSPGPGEAMRLAHEAGLLGHILPELEACTDMPRGPGRAGALFDHILKATDSIEPELHLRLAALLHDIGKPGTLARGDAGALRFPNHERVGAALAQDALERLRYPRELVRKVTTLVRYHMFAYDPATRDKGIRRLVASLGLDTIYDLAKLREADRAATGAGPGPGSNMAAFLARVNEVMAKGPVLTVRDLAVDGRDVMKALGIPQGPEVGKVLSKLLDAVLENPDLNSRERLLAFLYSMEPIGLST